MRKSLTAALAAASLLALAGCNKQGATGNEVGGNAAATASGDAVSGTWKADLSTVQFDQKPDELLLQGGKFSCKTCIPPVDIAADGAFHPVSGSKYYDTLSVKVVDDHNVTRTAKKGDRVVGETNYAVSGDGNTLTGNFTNSSTPNAPPTKGTFVETRVAAGPAGSHVISGSWKPSKVENLNEEALTTTYKLDGDTLHMSTPSGQSYDAKLDGTDTPINGDTGGTTASVKKVGDNSYEETDKQDGKVIGVTTFSVGADGKMNVTSTDKRDNSTVKYVANRE